MFYLPRMCLIVLKITERIIPLMIDFHESLNRMIHGAFTFTTVTNEMYLVISFVNHEVVKKDTHTYGKHLHN